MEGAGEPEGADGQRASDDGEDQSVLPAELVARYAGQDAAGGVDAVVDGQQDGAESGGVA